MRLAELGPAEAARRLRGDGLRLQVGRFGLNIRTRLPDLVRDVIRLYADQRVDDRGFSDFHVSVAPPSGIRRWLRPQVEFLDDGLSPFKPLPRPQAIPLLEWGLNWCIATRAHHHLILHAAVVERGGRAAILPADPGAGKSTLCTGLVHAGWRLLSDELALVDLDSGEVHPLVRPISLKNESIEVIRARHPEVVFSQVVPDTTKGTLALVKPPRESVERNTETATPAWVVTPEYRAGAAPSLEPASRATTFMELAHNGFNYSIHGRRGFDMLGAMVDRCRCFHFVYSRLDDACAVFDDLAEAR